MNDIRENLMKELYPLDTSLAYRWRAVLLFGLFVFLFLLVFQPFGLSGDIPNKIIVLLGYGLVTSFGVWVFNFVLPSLFPKFFLEEKWYVWKELFVTMGAIVFIAFLNLLYSHLLNFFHLTTYNFLLFIGITFSLGIFPVTISVFVNYYIKLKQHQKDAHDYSEDIKGLKSQSHKPDSEWLLLKDEEGELLGRWKVEDVLRIESAQNYVEMYFFSGEKQLNRELIRITMKEVDQQTSVFNNLLRTHRSHIVNLDHVLDVDGNAQGLQLEMEASEETIPVARSRIAEFKKHLHTIE